MERRTNRCEIKRKIQRQVNNVAAECFRFRNIGQIGRKMKIPPQFGECDLFEIKQSGLSRIRRIRYFPFSPGRFKIEKESPADVAGPPKMDFSHGFRTSGKCDERLWDFALSRTPGPACRASGLESCSAGRSRTAVLLHPGCDCLRGRLPERNHLSPLRISSSGTSLHAHSHSVSSPSTNDIQKIAAGSRQIGSQAIDSRWN